MDKCSQNPKLQNSCSHGEASRIEWDFIKMSEQEEDIICRMHKLVGDKWELIAGRVPNRTAEEIEKYWLMRNSETFKSKRNIQHQSRQHS